MNRVLVSTLLALGAAWRAAAPVRPSGARVPSPADCAFDTASRIVVHRDTLGLAPIGANLQPASGVDEELSVADAIRSFFQPPASLSVPFWARVFAPLN